MSEPDVTTKLCSKCQIEKPVYEYHKHARETDGYRKMCKLCRAQSEGHKYVKPAPPGFQWCRKCDTLYPATREYFYWHKTDARFYPSCKTCHYARTRNWQKANYEFWYGRNRNWAITHPEKVAEGWQNWKIKHPEAYAAAKARRKITIKDWKAKNPERVKANAAKGKAKRRALLANAPGQHTAADILLQIASQTDKKGHLRCWWCGCAIIGAYHVDHRVALVKSGTNWPDNLVISCPTCNLSKHDKSAQEWAGRLI